MARRLQELPEYFNEEEAVALVDAAPSYPTRMAFRIMLKTGLLRRSEASALRWGNLEFHTDSSNRQHMLRPKTDQLAEEVVLYLDPAAVDALLASRHNEAVINLGANVFGLSAGQINRRNKAATKMVGLGDGFSAHSTPGGDDPRPERRGAELPELKTEARWDNPTMPTKYTEAQAAGRGAVDSYYRGDLRK